MKKRIVLFATFLLSTLTAFAQIEGRVVLEVGTGVPGASVTAAGEDGTIVATVTTDGEGKYAFKELRPGRYKIEVNSSSFRSVVRENVIVSEDRTTTLDITLTLADLGDMAMAPPLLINDNNNNGGLLPGGVKLEPCIKPLVTKWALDGLNAKKAQFFGFYCEVTNAQYKVEQAELLKEQVLEHIAVDLNSTLTIPKSVGLTYRECKQANAFYAGNSIVMCYELVDTFYKTFEKDGLKGAELDQSVDNAVTFAFYHELGHALVSVLDLPITGKEEDAVDQLPRTSLPTARTKRKRQPSTVLLPFS